MELIFDEQDFLKYIYIYFKNLLKFDSELCF